MYAQEMNITSYDYEDEQQVLKNEIAKGDTELMGPPPTPAGRNGGGSSEEPNDGGIGDSPIHGVGKTDLQDNLNSL